MIHYPDTIPVNHEEGLTHVLVAVAFEELLTEPDVEAVVILGLQFVAFPPNTVHDSAVF